MEHGCYKRMAQVFNERGTNRSKFAQKRKIAYPTLQHYWHTDKPPQGWIIEAFCQEYQVSADLVLFGREMEKHLRPALQDVVKVLRGYSDAQLLEIMGSVKQYVISFQMLPAGTD